MTLGVLGGTFDPIHNGHLAAAQAAQEALALDEIVLIPSRIPPHRASPAGASGEDRLAMARLAAAGRLGWSASRIELDREGRSFTYDTLAALNRPAVEVFFILGADAFADIATWSRYPAVLGLSNFVVVSRSGITLDSLRERVPSAFRRNPPCSPSSFRAHGSEEPRVILADAHTPDISATDIRRRVRAGESIRGLVPDAVADYISTHRLYRGQ